MRPFTNDGAWHWPLANIVQHCLCYLLFFVAGL